MTARSESRWPDLAGRIEGGRHILPVRVYFEDTDFSGLVYHTSYLRWCERGRSDFLRLLGVLAAAGGVAFFAAMRRRMTAFANAGALDDPVGGLALFGDPQLSRLIAIGHPAPVE